MHLVWVTENRSQIHMQMLGIEAEADEHHSVVHQCYVHALAVAYRTEEDY